MDRGSYSLLSSLSLCIYTLHIYIHVYPPTPVEARGSAQGSTVLWGPDVEDNFFFSIGIQRGRLAPKVRGINSCLGPELDGEKLRRGQCSGPGSARNRCLFGARTRWGKAVARSVLGARVGKNRREKWKKTSFVRDSEARIGEKNARNRGSFGARTRWGKAVARSVLGSEESRLVWGQN